MNSLETCYKYTLYFDTENASLRADSAYDFVSTRCPNMHHCGTRPNYQHSQRYTHCFEFWTTQSVLLKILNQFKVSTKAGRLFVEPPGQEGYKL